MQKRSFEELDEEFVGYFNVLLKLLRKIDPSVLLIPWVENGAHGPVYRDNEMECKEHINEYVDKIFLKQGNYAWCRMKIAFNNPEERILTEESFRFHNMHVFKESIQENYIATAGWFLGSTPDTNINELRDVLKTLLPMEIDLRYQPIRLRTGERVDMNHAVKAIHIYAGGDKCKSCYKALKEVYSPKNQIFPLGKIMRIVANTADPKAVVSPKQRTQAEVLKNKQKVFLKNIGTMSNYHIQGIDLFIEKCGVSLRQAVMSIKISKEATHNLFISADTNSWGGVTFTYAKEFEQEATSIIPVLPIYLAEVYNSHAWSWFNAEARSDLKDYSFNKDTGEIVSNEEEYIQDILDEDRWTSDKQDNPSFEFSISNWVVTKSPATGNFYNDNGTVVTDTSTHPDGTTTTDDAGSSKGGISSMTGDSQREILEQKLTSLSDAQLMKLLALLEPEENTETMADGKASHE